MEESTRYYIRAIGIELAVGISRGELEYKDECELCGRDFGKGSLKCVVASLDISDLERAEYWKGEVHSVLRAKIEKSIKKVLHDGKALCPRCYAMTWKLFERKFCAEEHDLIFDE